MAERRIRQKVSLVVLATGMVPAFEKDAASPSFGLRLDAHGLAIRNGTK